MLSYKVATTNYRVRVSLIWFEAFLFSLLYFVFTFAALGYKTVLIFVPPHTHTHTHTKSCFLLLIEGTSGNLNQQGAGTDVKIKNEGYTC